MKYPSRELTYEWGRIAPEQLAKEADILDTKILAIFSSASIIIGVISALVGRILFDATIIPFGIAVVSYIAILIKSLSVISPQWMFVADSPRILREKYWELEPDEAMSKYWDYVEKDFDANHKIVKKKGQTLSWIVRLLGVETILLIIWLFL